MFSLFKKSKELQAVRLNRIAKNSDIDSRIKQIVEHEFKRLLYHAEKEAINGKTSVIFDMRIDKTHLGFSNQIMYEFGKKLHEEGFSYTRHLLSNPRRFSVYFSD